MVPDAVFYMTSATCGKATGRIFVLIAGQERIIKGNSAFALSVSFPLTTQPRQGREKHFAAYGKHPPAPDADRQTKRCGRRHLPCQEVGRRPHPLFQMSAFIRRVKSHDAAAVTVLELLSASAGTGVIASDFGCLSAVWFLFFFCFPKRKEIGIKGGII